jgi:hypothetical protein
MHIKFHRNQLQKGQAMNKKSIASTFYVDLGRKVTVKVVATAVESQETTILPSNHRKQQLEEIERWGL